MGFEKRRVPLAAIEPSAANPREDFGDIAALADTIRATGGEPVNPPVVVADGNVFRIVDGERRYRALREIYKREPGRQVTALVADGMDAANELVAMLATDDKQPLTEEERARGVQQMLVLGVDTERVARAARAARGKVVAARKMAPLVPEGVQATLDQMLAASELPDDMAERVLGAGDRWRDEERRVRRELSEREAERAILAELQRVGIEATADAGTPEGHVYAGVVWARTAAGDADRLAAKGCDVAYLNGSSCYAYMPKAADGPSEEEQARRRAVDEDRAICGRVAESMCGFILSGGLSGELPPEIAEAAIEHRTDGFGKGLTVDAVSHVDGLPVSEADAAIFILTSVESFMDGVLSGLGIPSRYRAGELAGAYDLMELAGWEPDEDMAAKRAELAELLDDGDDD